MYLMWKRAHTLVVVRTASCHRLPYQPLVLLKQFAAPVSLELAQDERFTRRLAAELAAVANARPRPRPRAPARVPGVEPSPPPPPHTRTCAVWLRTKPRTGLSTLTHFDP